MPPVRPYIPMRITVHLGTPDSAAENVTVPFIDYVKNVVSSEIYPTWEETALIANSLAIISYALNRVYTEYYRSRGYPFDITNTTAFDQKFIPQRTIFENISELIDGLFSSYIRKVGFIEPLAAKFCNGTSSTCDGMSQWGAQDMALKGADSIQILRSYYGEDIEIVNDAPIMGIAESYPGTPLRRGDVDVNVVYIQASLDRISQNYPAIPKVALSGVFDESTEASVRAFQSIFSLTVDGIVGRATWYQMVRIYVAVQKLSELRSQGQQFTGAAFEYPGFLQLGDSGVGIPLLQYILSVISAFLDNIPPVIQSGVFDESTKNAVEAFQESLGFAVTGMVDAETWGALYAQYASIENSVFDNSSLFPSDNTDFSQSTRFLQFPGSALSQGDTDREG